MAISDKLQELLDIKQDIKVAIENKGADLTGVEFSGYAEKIDEIETGGGPQGETWLINSEPSYYGFTTTINFVSNSTQYTFISFAFEPSNNGEYVLKYNYNTVGTSPANQTHLWSWVDEAFRTITFETAPTGDLLTWLEANATKQTDELPAVVELTQAQYDALSVYDDNTYYLIVEE